MRTNTAIIVMSFGLSFGCNSPSSSSETEVKSVDGKQSSPAVDRLPGTTAPDPNYVHTQGTGTVQGELRGNTFNILDGQLITMRVQNTNAAWLLIYGTKLEKSPQYGCEFNPYQEASKYGIAAIGFSWAGGTEADRKTLNGIDLISGDGSNLYKDFNPDDVGVTLGELKNGRIRGTIHLGMQESSGAASGKVTNISGDFEVAVCHRIEDTSEARPAK